MISFIFCFCIRVRVEAEKTQQRILKVLKMLGKWTTCQAARALNLAVGVFLVSTWGLSTRPILSWTHVPV